MIPECIKVSNYDPGLKAFMFIVKLLVFIKLLHMAVSDDPSILQSLSTCADTVVGQFDCKWWITWYVCSFLCVCSVAEFKTLCFGILMYNSFSWLCPMWDWSIHMNEFTWTFPTSHVIWWSDIFTLDKGWGWLPKAESFPIVHMANCIAWRIWAFNLTLAPFPDPILVFHDMLYLEILVIPLKEMGLCAIFLYSNGLWVVLQTDSSQNLKA